MADREFSKLKGEERRWAIREAADTLRRHSEIMKEPDLLKAAEKELDNQEDEIKAAKKFINAVNSKSHGMKVDEES